LSEGLTLPLYLGLSMQTLILGSSGFLGTHLMAAQQGPPSLELVPLPRSAEVDLLSRSSRKLLAKTVHCKNVLILSWASTVGPQFDQGLAHHHWAVSIIDLVEELGAAGIKCWIAGAGTDFESPTTLSAYATAKKLVLSTFESRWSSQHCYLSLPYIYSIYHRRPRIVFDAIQRPDDPIDVVCRNPYAAHDYLDVRDVAKQVLITLARDEIGIARITSGARTSNEQLVRFARGLETDVASSCTCNAAEEPTNRTPLFHTQSLLELA